MFVDISAHLIAPLDSSVTVDGDGLRSSDGRRVVQVLQGCNAVDVCALLAAAMLAHPTTFLRSLTDAVLIPATHPLPTSVSDEG